MNDKGKRKIEQAVADHMDAEARRLHLGATGQYPDGSLGPDDEGELIIGISIKADMVVINLGKAVSWVCLPAADARQLAALLIARADVIEASPQT